ncbi:probable dolichyl pyrophosphate Glc1Man9GlcNAc2 alpha-1,3-glucosyltransferase isoform X2 [Agrilus planipennis]|nr:probable dolichyl pyrophosphate Glc1Man9GlcNAc2 alpha-1,3-glucosyltransferase isoform X3 [Agrilus planipennis]XP_025828893.1 probable dolichyl pyrophosphate Glc1Man9GlcNAc2 alpha-1,3-glucosyltransferase isoform X2 [Agrilus planipennis]
MSLKSGWKTEVVLTLLLISNVGLLMVDHIHFQYNGFLYGILLLSVANMIQGKYLKGAFWFTILINLKHIYIYMGPTYFVYLLHNYCFDKVHKSSSFKDLLNSFSFINTAKLGAVVIGVFLVTYLPFIDQLGQVLSRLFPFKRGLCHAYWAPNIWAVYNVLDKGAFISAKQMGFNVTSSPAVMTGGLVQEFSHSILPNITPFVTLIITAFFMLPGCIKLWSYGNSRDNFVRSLILCSLTSFLFGWHVHEKAILMTIIPLSILSIFDREDAKIFLLLSAVGHYSLFPLLFPRSLIVVKVLLYVVYTTYEFYSLSYLFPLRKRQHYTLPLLNFYESFYLFSLVPLFLYENFIHSFLGLSKTLPFLPLMTTSVYCSFGIIYCWAKYFKYFFENDKSKIKK